MTAKWRYRITEILDAVEEIRDHLRAISEATGPRVVVMRWGDGFTDRQQHDITIVWTPMGLSVSEDGQRRVFPAGQPVVEFRHFLPPRLK